MRFRPTSDAGCRSCRAILDPVHGLVGRLDQPFGAVRDIGQRGDADRGRQRDAEAVGFEKPVGREPIADALADRHGAVAGGVGQDERELVAAEPGDDVGFARAGANHAGRFHERTAAEQMPVRVVDRLEAVEIDEQQRQRAVLRGARLVSRRRTCCM